jgi:AcrR family transcriptional regulator
MKNDRTTRNKIISVTRKEFARFGAEGISMRLLGKKVGVSPSVIYYYFPNKNRLFRSMFDETNTLLGKKRSRLPKRETFPELLEQRIAFQFDESESVTAVLKYYLYARRTFAKQDQGGYIPEKSALHIEEILRIGRTNQEILPEIDIVESAKVVTHAINGFVTEYYPHPLRGQERREVIRAIASLLYPALTGGKYPEDISTKHSKSKKKGGEQL